MLRSLLPASAHYLIYKPARFSCRTLIATAETHTLPSAAPASVSDIQCASASTLPEAVVKLAAIQSGMLTCSTSSST
jgi:hypothetical protein